jgi:hypothetical protein
MVTAISIVFLSKSGNSVSESAQGISYTNVVIAEVPWSIQVIRIPRGTKLYEIQSRHADSGALGLDTLSDQVVAANTDQSEPVAAINGGFFLRDNGQTNAYAGAPRGLQIIAGEVLSAPCSNTCLWIDYAREPHADNVISQFEITWPDERKTPFELNGECAANGVEIYTPAAGKSTHTTGGLELILEPLKGGRWLPLRMERDYPARVREIRKYGNSPLGPDTMVISIGPAIMKQFQGVNLGAVVRISTRSMPDLLTAKTAISGGPLLLQDGRRQEIHAAPDAAYEFSSMLERHPRTAFGWNDESFFLVQVDGRQKDLSLGMTLDELSAYLIKLGCTDAINLDGGGSSSLWFDGKVRNNPCDGYERYIANSLVILQKKSKANDNHLVSKTARSPTKVTTHNGD